MTLYYGDFPDPCPSPNGDKDLNKAILGMCGLVVLLILVFFI